LQVSSLPKASWTKHRVDRHFDSSSPFFIIPRRPFVAFAFTIASWRAASSSRSCVREYANGLL
jgi:hypothetical protein